MMLIQPMIKKLDKLRVSRCLITALNTLDSGTCKAERMDGVSKFGLMVLFMKDIGQMTRLTAEVDLFTLMVTFTTVSGRMTKLTVMVCTTILMVPSMKVTGLRISNMAKVKKYGQTMLATKASTKKERSTEWENSTGLMVQHTQVNSTTIILKVVAFILGPMAVSMMESGATTKCTVLVYSLGPMAAAMKEIISTIKRKVKVFSHGPMVVNTMANGKTESNTELVSTIQARVTSRRVSGVKANVFNG